MIHMPYVSWVIYSEWVANLFKEKTLPFSVVRDCFYKDGVLFNPMTASRDGKIAAVAAIAISGGIAFICALSGGVPFVASLLIGLSIAAIVALIAFIVLKKITPDVPFPVEDVKEKEPEASPRQSMPPAPSSSSQSVKAASPVEPAKEVQAVKKEEDVPVHMGNGRSTVSSEKSVKPKTCAESDVDKINKEFEEKIEASLDDENLFDAINDD